MSDSKTPWNGRHLAVAGGGIGGLTFAIAARRMGFAVTVYERRSEALEDSAGGGLGLWPPAQAVMALLGVLPALDDVGAYMPAPSYRTKTGHLLASPSRHFSTRFPILCLRRDALIRILFEQCLSVGVTIRFDCAVGGYSAADPHRVRVKLSTGESACADVLVGADGIHSRVRTHLLREEGLADLGAAVDCGYAYFRAVLPVKRNLQHQWHEHAFESWGEGKRFGYVPLREPETFWFASLPIGCNGLRPRPGAARLDEAGKRWLMDCYDGWRGPCGTAGHEVAPILRLLEATPATAILRTDILKVPHVTKIPWRGQGGRVVLIGDACHATAPNLAQGAGLSIEDAAELAYQLGRAALHRPSWRETLDTATAHYQGARKPRAKTVQTMADTVARVGQWSGARASVRNRIMTFGNRFAPALAAAIFEHTVSKSLGGDPSTLHWMPPQSNLKACTVPLKESVLDDDVVSDDDVVTVVERTVDDPTGAAVTSLLGSVLGFGHIRKLPEHIQRFRRRLNRGHGTGVVSVRADNGALVSCVRRVARLPATMEQGPFTASVNSAPGPFAHRRPQTWTRGFGSGRDGAVYATTHRTLRSLHSDCARGVVLLEGVGGVFDRWVQFGYVAESIDAGCESCGVHFRSIGVWLGERFRLPLPSWLLPRSQWDEVSTNDGWTFDGKISLPEVLGGCCLMHYFGHFVPSLDVEAKVSDGRHALVAGGTGLLGRAVCERLARNGFTVSVLTRQCRPDELPVGALRAVWWEPTSDESQAFQWSALVDEHTVIINLSGENPGAHRWTKTVMDRIADSRLRSVEALRIGISLASKEHRRPVAVLQASATGVYSDAGNQTLTECDAAVEQPQRVDSERGVCAIGTQFRVHCCHRIEAAAADISQAVLPHMLPVVNLRIGMVLSARGGVLPHLLKANSFGVRCIGSGDQWIPWIHVQDAAGMIAALSEADHLQGTINVTAQQPVQHHSLMKAINDSRGSALPRLWSLPGEPFAAWVGPSASVILDSTRAVPLRWSNGEFEYSFEYRTVREALESWECRADD